MKTTMTSDPQSSVHDITIGETRFRLKAEWEPQEAVVVAFPDASMDWAPMLDEIRACYHELVRCLLFAGSHVVVLANSADEARRFFSQFPQQSITYVETPLNDTWVRDFGPLSVEKTEIIPADPESGRPESILESTLLLDFGFNGWGLKFAADRDNLVNLRVKDRAPFSEYDYLNNRGFVLEGGSIESDGQGTILTTSRCLCSENRNGGLNKTEAEEALHRYLGADHVLWLDHGHLTGDDTDGHIDTLARLCPGNTIVYSGPPTDSSDEQFESLTLMRQQLQDLTTPEGLPYNLIELPMPAPVLDPADGHRLPATYANFLITNSTVLVPTYRQPRLDSLALKMLRIAFPDHQVVGVDCRALLRQHGSLHCATMQIAARKEAQ